MSEFGKAIGKNSDKPFEVIDILANLQKNRTATLRVARVNYRGGEFIQLQVWNIGENGTEYPVKNQNIIIKTDVAYKLGEVLIKV